MEALRLRFLGEFTVELAGERIKAFATDKVRALFAYLAVEADRQHRRERLAGLLWPEKPENLARHSLSQALSSLRKLNQIDPGLSLLEITSQEVLFQPEACWLDTRAFADLIQSCTAHSHDPELPCPSCVERLEKAVALYRGDFLAGFSLGGCAAF